jgi:hypothetical protein
MSGFVGSVVLLGSDFSVDVVFANSDATVKNMADYLTMGQRKKVFLYFKTKSEGPNLGLWISAMKVPGVRKACGPDADILSRPDRYTLTEGPWRGELADAIQHAKTPPREARPKPRLKKRPQEEEKGEVMSRRIVNIYALDVDPDVPAEEALVYANEGLVTDDCDKDLCHTFITPQKLAVYNKKRVTWKRKKHKGDQKTQEPLPPIKFSELSVRISAVMEE